MDKILVNKITDLLNKNHFLDNEIIAEKILKLPELQAIQVEAKVKVNFANILSSLEDVYKNDLLKWEEHYSDPKIANRTQLFANYRTYFNIKMNVIEDVKRLLPESKISA